MGRRVAVLVVVWCSRALAQVEPPGQGTQPGDLAGAEPFDSAYTACRTCHDQTSAREEDPIYMPFDGWASSMMGNSVRDPLFLAAVDVANQDVPGVGAWCLKCHAPQAFVRGHTNPPDAGAFDDLDREGVTCDVCHRSIAATDAGGPFLSNAQLTYERTNAKHGPYIDIESPRHAGVDSGFTTSSELCGQCHQVENPLHQWRSADGGVLGSAFPLDTTYDEWRHSAFGAPDSGSFVSCQGCHMPQMVGEDGGTSYWVAKFGPRRDRPRRHVLAGANLFGLKAVQLGNPELVDPNGLNLGPSFALTTEFTLKNLREAATVSVSGPASAAPGGEVDVVVTVQNKTGHKLPTGYGDGRRMVVQLLVDGTVVSGAFDGGALLTDSQLRVYEARHGTAANGAGEHLALHEAIIKDSRIPPAGLQRSPKVAPVGVTWFDLPDGGLSDTDRAVFRVKLPSGATSPVSVTARLVFQTTTPEYVHFLAAENHTSDAGRRLLDIYEQLGGAPPAPMTEASTTIALVAPDAGGAGGGTAQGTDGGSGSDPTRGTCGCAGGPGLSGLLLLATWLRGRVRKSRATQN